LRILCVNQSCTGSASLTEPGPYWGTCNVRGDGNLPQFRSGNPWCQNWTPNLANEWVCTGFGGAGPRTWSTCTLIYPALRRHTPKLAALAVPS
jgi:hypothetical protein